jgi:signal transduction histidine kinase
MKMPVFTNTLAFRISGTFLLLLMISGAGFWWWLRGTDISGDIEAAEEAWYAEGAEQELDDLASDLAPVVGNLELLTQKIVSYGQHISFFDAEVIVFDPEGGYLSSSQPDSLGMAVPLVDPTLLTAMSAGDWDYGSYPLPEDIDAYENRIFEVDRLHLDNDPANPVIGFLAASYSPLVISVGDIETAERKLGLNAIALLLVYSGLSGLVIMVWTTRRVRRLNDGVAAFAAGDFNTRVPASSGDEIGALGRNFNDMAHSIETMMDKLRDKEQFQRQLIANISHDLRTPMASMRGYVESLSMQANTMSPSDRERYLAIITGNLVHLDKLIDHMLVLSRFDSGQATFQMEDFPLPELADSVLARCEGLAQERNIKLDLTVDDSDTLVHADPLQIAQVLQNLVENGIKYNTDGGQVIITLKGGEQLVEVKVQDTGLGISAEDLPHIFKRFYTADKSRTRAEVGSGMAAARDHLGQSSGLGLAIASKIVAGHNSMLQVDSRLGEGTTFTFMLKSASGRNSAEQAGQS